MPTLLQSGIAVPGEFRYNRDYVRDFHALTQALNILLTIKKRLELNLFVPMEFSFHSNKEVFPC